MENYKKYFNILPESETRMEMKNDFDSLNKIFQAYTTQKLERSTQQQADELIKLLFATNLAAEVITSRRVFWNTVADLTGNEEYRYYYRYGNKIDKWSSNSGYDTRTDGTMASVRALEAEEQGTFSMGNFVKIYGVSRQHFDFLKALGIIQNTEWHHTGKSFKETEFFSWKDSKRAEGIISYEFDGINIINDELQEEGELSLATLYAQNKKELTKITKEFKNLNWEYKLPKTEINVPTFDDYSYREGKNNVSLTREEENQKWQRHEYISEFLADNGMPSWERRLEHEQVDKEFRNILNKRIEEYVNQNRELLLKQYDEIYSEDLKKKADIERYNAEIDSLNLSTNGKEKVILDFAQKFGLSADVAYKLVRRYSQSVQFEEQRKAEQQEKEEHNKKVKKSIEEEEKELSLWLETLIAGGYVERFSRTQSKPSDFSIITYREMYGKYGWFNSEHKSYNLPEYFSGFTFNDENHYNQYQEKKQAIRELSNNIRFHAVWHGSPHNFNKFSTETIGTGAGSQTYGWGLYFTDNESIAQMYANSNKNIHSFYSYKGQRIDYYDLLDQIALEINSVESHSRYWISDYLTDIELKNITYARKKIKETIDYVKSQRNNSTNPSYYDNKLLVLNKLLNIKGIRFLKQKSNLYKVAIHGNKTIDELNFIRWDKPVSKELFDLIHKADSNLSERYFHRSDSVPYNGEMLYKVLSRYFNSDKEASLFLLRAGIDGIQYPVCLTLFNYRGYHCEKIKLSNTTKNKYSFASVLCLSDIYVAISI